MLPGVEIREFAEQVLFGATLDDKLVDPSTLTDRDPGVAIVRPTLPGRPRELRLDGPERSYKFPGLTRDCSEETRGRALHFFANHELLAIELMALFLLRFPQAPPAFRRAVAATIREEQEHMRLYQGRMSALGVAFGEVPVSSFFWDCLADMTGPEQYLAGLSLTLEQANLDYALHYQRRFAEMGDLETAAVLKTVLDDEIGHVSLGVNWMEALRAEGDNRSLWDRYRAALPAPLTPARGRGPELSREVRVAAGLDDDFIDHVTVFGHSKGRPPYIYLFNPTAEASFVDGFRSSQVPKHIRQLATDLDTLPMFLAGADDVVVTSSPPRLEFLSMLTGLGFALPEFWSQPVDDLAERRLGGLRPWGWSPDAATRLEPLRDQLGSGWPGEPSSEVFTKAWSAASLAEWVERQSDDWVCPQSVVGQAFTNPHSALARARVLAGDGRIAVIKATLGTAGRGLLRYRGDRDEERVAGWVTRTVREQGACVVEPWLDGVVDLSVQIDVAEDGRVSVLGVTRFTTSGRGQYLGTALGSPLRGLGEGVRRFVIGPGRGKWRVFQHLEAVARWVGERLFLAGHRGPAGIDALVYRDHNRALRLKPIVEVNPRFTMGHLALAIGKKLHRRQQGTMRVIGLQEATKAGFDCLGDYVASLGDVPTGVLRDSVVDGVVPLTDPVGARRAVMVLVAGEP